jgi:hypothetical protein
MEVKGGKDTGRDREAPGPHIRPHILAFVANATGHA